MRLSEVCIRRPVFSWVMTFVLIGLGIICWNRLRLQQYPNIERPFITIEASLPGSSPEIIESQVTRFIEDAVAGIEGVMSITSTSSVEDSKVVVEADSSRSSDSLSAEINERLRKARDRFPREMNDPTLTKSRAEDRAIMKLALTSDELDPSTLADYALREIQKDVEAISGVARVEVLGAGLYKMRLKLDPVKLSAYRITVAEVMEAVRRQNVEKPAGRLVSQDRQYLVTTIASIETPEEFDQLPIAVREGHLIHLYDLGKAELSAEDQKSRTRFNGKPGVSLDIFKQAEANPIDVARSIKKMIPTIEERLPANVTMHIGGDRTLFIEDSIKNVYDSILEATVLVILVVVAFLRSIRASIIPLVTIPVSLIGTFFLMYLCNFSVNTFTLLAMVLAIGLVVDDAIVVLENIYRHIEEGMKPFKAAVKGIQEISFSIIAMTLTLAAVYIPIALTPGTIGKFFTEFAITLAGSVIISGFAALTLSPMMCARMLRHSPVAMPSSFYEHQGRIRRAWSFITSDAWLTSIDHHYARGLKKLHETRKKSLLTVLGGAVFALLALFVFYQLPNEMFPKEDQGSIFIDGQASQSATLEYTDKYVKELDDVIASVPEVKRRVTQINNPTYDVSMQLHENRKRTTKEVEQYLKAALAKVTGLEVKIDTGGGGTGDSSNMVQFVVQTNKSYGELKAISSAMTQAVYASGITDGVLSNSHPDTEDFTIVINRAKASSLNIDPLLIADTIDTLIRGRKSTTFKKDNKLYDVMVEVKDEARQTPRDITNLFLKAGTKEEPLVPISEMIDVASRAGPTEVYRYNRMRAISYSVRLKPEAGGLGEGIKVIQQIAKDTLPEGARIEFTGETKRFLTESANVKMVFLWAIIFIYLIMAAQFESWVDPFIIILSVPLSLAGAVLTLGVVDGGSLNLYSQIGLVTLIGLITKHGIMMVDVANRLRLDEKLQKYEAIIKACCLRLRPILMTTFAMVLGAVPLALATGSGSESRRQIGWVIVGGMSIGTLFTLFVLPAFYIFFSRKTLNMERKHDADHV